MLDRLQDYSQRQIYHPLLTVWIRVSGEVLRQRDSTCMFQSLAIESDHAFANEFVDRKLSHLSAEQRSLK